MLRKKIPLKRSRQIRYSKRADYKPDGFLKKDSIGGVFLGMLPNIRTDYKYSH